MKAIGLIGGMSWESTETYYRRINELVRERLGGYHSARIVMESVDFAPFEARLRSGGWEWISRELAAAAHRLERAGAACIALCTNTMHKVAPAIEAAISIPFLHIADGVGEVARHHDFARLALLGTAFTMEDPFYADRLAERFSIDVVTPDAADRAEVHRIIFAELVHGIVRDESRATYRAIMATLADGGAQAVILGCTEIGMLVDGDDAAVPLFDTTELHAAAVVRFALDGA